MPCRMVLRRRAAEARAHTHTHTAWWVGQTDRLTGQTDRQNVPPPSRVGGGSLLRSKQRFCCQQRVHSRLAAQFSSPASIQATEIVFRLLRVAQRTRIAAPCLTVLPLAVVEN